MALLEAFWKMLVALLALLGRIGSILLGHRKPTEPCCTCPPALKKPDPLIYCQYYLMSLGYPVTWDNPDIYIFEGGAPVDPHDLKPATAYTVVARIWNNSTDVPVVNLGVAFSYLSFGMGTQSHPIGTTTTDLAAKGLPGCPAFAPIVWTTPATPGHYCLQVLLLPPDDSNWQNNLGQRNTDVAQPHSPAAFTFAVGNHTGPRPRAVRFTTDAYAIPPLRPCGEGGPRPVDKGRPPVPDGWTVVLAPATLRLPPGDEKEVQVKITPPAGFSGSMPINVTGWDDTGPIGGVTLTVEVP
jgi:hypothetical protein